MWEISLKEDRNVEESSDELIDKLIKRKVKKKAEKLGLDKSITKQAMLTESGTFEPFDYSQLESTKEIPFKFTKKSDCC